MGPSWCYRRLVIKHTERCGADKGILCQESAPLMAGCAMLPILKCCPARPLSCPLLQVVIDVNAIKKKIAEEQIKESQRPGAKRYI